MMQEVYSTNDYRNYLQHAQWKWPGGKNSSEYSGNDFRMYQEDYLCHHGRLGQRKGVKNGPPYPLGEDQLTSVYEKNGGMSESAKEVYGEGGSSGSEKKPEKKSLLRKMKERKVRRELELELEEMRRKEQEKIRNQEEENRKQLQREAEEKFEQAKKSAIDKGDKKWVKDHFDKLTNQELEVALNRINYRQRVDTAYEEKVKTGWDRMDSVMKHIGQMTEWARKGTNAYNTGVKIYNAFHPEDPLPYIFDPQQQSQKKKDKDKDKGDKNGGNGGNGNKS